VACVLQTGSVLVTLRAKRQRTEAIDVQNRRDDRHKLHEADPASNGKPNGIARESKAAHERRAVIEERVDSAPFWARWFQWAGRGDGMNADVGRT
jgi:hypothetical protein